MSDRKAATHFSLRVISPRTGNVVFKRIYGNRKAYRDMLAGDYNDSGYEVETCDFNLATDDLPPGFGNHKEDTVDSEPMAYDPDTDCDCDVCAENRRKLNRGSW